MSAFEDFKPGYCSIDEFHNNGPPVAAGHLLEDSQPYITMFALETSLWPWRRKQAAKYLGEVTAVNHIDLDFYAVEFTAFDAKGEPLLEADTMFRGSYLWQAMRKGGQPLKLNKQTVNTAYFMERPSGGSPLLPDDGERELQDMLRNAAANRRRPGGPGLPGGEQERVPALH